MRPSWNEYFMNIATLTAKRSTCKRKSVGAVLVKDNNIIATGYNGSLSGAPHCIDTDCIMQDGHCIATIHAEVNAVLAAAKNGVSTVGSVIYCNVEPCINCYKIIHQAGITKIYYKESYGKSDPVQILSLASSIVREQIK